MKDDFDKWNRIKRRLEKNKDFPLFHEREIWWCHIGHNVGHEENGKNRTFSRPVLITKKFNYRLFRGIPLSTQIKDSPFYHSFEANGRQQAALLSQERPYDAARLGLRIVKISEEKFMEIKKALKELS